MEFFKDLPNTFHLNSFRIKEKLLYWNISFEHNNTYHFLFGGMDYSERDTYDSYANNLVSIIKDGLDMNCSQINLGQTAEISKSRLGAVPLPKAMFLYHKNKLINGIFRSLRTQLTYSPSDLDHHIYKNPPAERRITNRQFQYAET